MLLTTWIWFLAFIQQKQQRDREGQWKWRYVVWGWPHKFRGVQEEQGYAYSTLPTLRHSIPPTCSCSACAKSKNKAVNLSWGCPTLLFSAGLGRRGLGSDSLGCSSDGPCLISGHSVDGDGGCHVWGRQPWDHWWSGVDSALVGERYAMVLGSKYRQDVGRPTFCKGYHYKICFSGL